MEATAFFTSKPENKAAELNCRIWNVGIGLTKDEVDALCDDLNEAIKPVVEKWVGKCDERVRKHYQSEQP